MLSFPGLKAGYSREVNPCSLQPHITAAPHLFKAALFATAAADRWLHAVNAVLGARK
jgi:hypothetical protein